jgi:uncharacterized protein (DUF1330 family)
MKYYGVLEIDVTDLSWVQEYVNAVTPMVQRHGGRYLARSGSVHKLEGQRPAPQTVVIIEWPSMEVAQAFFASDEYRPYRGRRQAGARNQFLLVAGVDVAQTAQIAP